MSTPPRIIAFIVGSIALLALICVFTVCMCASTGLPIDGELRGALISLTSGLVGALTSMLVNTRTQPQDPTVNDSLNVQQ